MSKTIPLVCVFISLTAGAAQIPEQDSRNVNVHDSNTHFTMPVFKSREAWLEHAAFLRKQILASAGLWPMPEKKPIHAEVFGRLERNGYTIDQEYLGRFYIPGLRKAGDFRAAAVVDSEGKLFLHDAGPDFPADWVKGSAKAGGLTTTEIRNAKASEAELLGWLR